MDPAHTLLTWIEREIAKLKEVAAVLDARPVTSDGAERPGPTPDPEAADRETDYDRPHEQG